MGRMILAKIDVTKINKDRLFCATSGAKYLDVVLMENDEVDQYGNHFVIKESLKKEERASGVKAKILGNAKFLGGGQSTKKPAPTPKTEASDAPPGDNGPEEKDDVPF